MMEKIQGAPRKFLTGPGNWLGSKRLLLFLLFTIVLITGFLVIFSHKVKTGKTGVKLLQATSQHSSHLYDLEFFKQADEKGINFMKNPGNGRAAGGIIPHHLLASPIISGFFQSLSSQNPSTVILIGPNHYDVGKANILVSNYDWETPFGFQSADGPKIRKLEEKSAAFTDETVFDNEHSIYTIIPFIKKTWKEVKIVPIILKSNTSKEECERLIRVLREIIDDRTLVIASVDFSHYLPSAQADIYDKESLSAISSFDTEKIFSLDGQKNFDSPPTIYTLVSLMKEIGAIDQTLIINSNSAKLTDQPDIKETTSYVSLYFQKPSEQSSNMNLEDVFSYNDPELETAEVRRVNDVKLIATGDVIPARSVNFKMSVKNDFTYPFQKTAAFLRSGDIVFINLESPFVKDCEVTVEGMRFCGNEQGVEGLKYANVKVANIANNHSGNYGLPGIENTIRLLNGNGIAVTGIGAPAILTVKNKKFGFLGYNDVGESGPEIASADEEKITREERELKQQVDFIIVTFHWGIEYTSTPSVRQKELAHTAIDNGADLVIGNHPHWVQGVEKYKDKFIAYAHGNFVFDQMWSQETREGVLGQYDFSDDGLTGVKYFPVIIDNYAQPRFATKSEAEKILGKMKEVSSKMPQFNP